jgi:hypothetical protein
MFRESELGLEKPVARRHTDDVNASELVINVEISGFSNRYLLSSTVLPVGELSISDQFQM